MISKESQKGRVLLLGPIHDASSCQNQKYGQEEHLMFHKGSPWQSWFLQVKGSDGASMNGEIWTFIATL